MANQTERPTPEPEFSTHGAEYGAKQPSEDSLATKSLGLCRRVGRALNQGYDQYGAWLILAVACGFFLSVGYSAGFRESQDIFGSVYDKQQASFDERIQNARGMIASKDQLISKQSDQLATCGVKSIDASQDASKATQVLGEALKNQVKQALTPEDAK